MVRLQVFGDISQAELLQTAGAVEQSSNHPTAKAIQKLAAEAGLELPLAEDLTETHGKGVSGKVNGVEIIVGRANWMKEQNLDIPAHDDLEAEGLRTYLRPKTCQKVMLL